MLRYMLKSLWDKKLFKDHCNGRFRQTHNRPPIFYYYFTSELYDQIPADAMCTSMYSVKCVLNALGRQQNTFHWNMDEENITSANRKPKFWNWHLPMKYGYGLLRFRQRGCSFWDLLEASCVHAKLHQSCLTLQPNGLHTAHQAPLSMGFSRQ